MNGIQQLPCVQQLCLCLIAGNDIKILIIAVLTDGKRVAEIVRKANIENLRFDIMLLEIRDYAGMLFKIYIIQRENRANGMKNCVIGAVGAVSQ